MLLAELEVFHSRPIAPTRRVALGACVLPTSPAPGFGGVLLGGVVARFLPGIDPDLHDELNRLSRQLEAGRRIPQPRLRHRFQDDRIGLTAYQHRLVGHDGSVRFEIDESASASPTVLAAFYAAGRLDRIHRSSVFAVMHRAMGWTGPIDSSLVDFLTDSKHSKTWASLGGVDPVRWALDVFDMGDSRPGRDEVQQRFRSLLRAAHPDHGGAAHTAADRITELTEARRILLSRSPRSVT